MEDVWKDLAFLADPTAVANRSTPHDFLGSLPRDSHLSNNKTDRPENGEDSRYARMVKNRASAARSRARRQAYTYELELEIAHLQKENALLRKQLQHKEDLCLAKQADAAAEPPKKHSLHRTLTAPF